MSVGTLRARLEGDNAELGKIPAGDVAKLLTGLERAVAQAASVILGEPKTTPGRRKGVVEQSVRFRLAGIEPGSVQVVLEAPDPAPVASDRLPLSEGLTLGQAAILELLNTVELEPTDPVIAAAVVSLAEDLDLGERYNLTLGYQSTGLVTWRTVRIDREVRQRLSAWLEPQSTATRDEAVVGTLVEADFENFSARLRSPTGEAITISFGEDLADDIQEALRRPAEFEGEVSYDPRTSTARSVTLKRIRPGKQLMLGIDPGLFWQKRSFAELAKEQDVAATSDPETLYDPDITEEEAEAFLAELAQID